MFRKKMITNKTSINRVDDLSQVKSAGGQEYNAVGLVLRGKI
jgi:hypothetical protein